MQYVILLRLTNYGLTRLYRCVCFHPMLKTTKILLNILRMTFSDKTLGCGFYFICRYKLLESSRDATNVRHVAFKKQLPFKTSAHFCSNYTFLNTKITKCNCLAQTHLLSRYAASCVCWYPVFACLYADFCLKSKFILYLTSFPA